MAIINISADAVRKHATTYTVLANICWVLLVVCLAVADIWEWSRLAEIDGFPVALYALILVIPLGFMTVALNHHSARWASTKAERFWNTAVSAIAAIMLTIMLLIVVLGRVHFPDFDRAQAVFASAAATIRAGGSIDALLPVVRATEMTLLDLFGLVFIIAALFYAYYDWLIQNHKAFQATSLREGEIPTLEAEIERLKGELATVTADRDSLQSQLRVARSAAATPRNNVVTLQPVAPGVAPLLPEKVPADLELNIRVRAFVEPTVYLSEQTTS